MSEPGASERVFCAPWFRPLIVLTVIAVVGAVAGAMVKVCSRPRGGIPGDLAGPGGVLPVATAPPITAGTPAPHKDFGHCTRCHDVRGAGAGALPVATAPPIPADAKLVHPDWGRCPTCHQITGAPPAATGALPVATAPPIARGVKATHPDWGPCGKCHQYTGAGATTVAWRPTSGSLLGIRLDKLGAKQADLLEMEGVKGPLVTEVIAGSPAAAAGLKADDAILKINNEAVTSAAEVRRALRAIKAGDKVKLQVQRGERTKNVFVRMPDLGAGPALAAAVTAPAAPGVPPPPAVALVPGRLAIAVTGVEPEAQVAPIFSGAPYFLVRDAAAGWAVLPNPGLGSLTRGQAAAAMLLGQGVAVVIAGNVGPGAFATLRRAGVQVYSGAFGSAARVYQSYLAGALVPATTTVVRAPLPAPPVGVVAVAALGPGLAYPVAPSLAESPYLVLYDLATGRAQAVANPADGRVRAEIVAAQRLVDRGARAAIAGTVSPGAVQALAQLNVMVFAGVTGTVADAITMYAQGRLQAATLGAGRPPAGPGVALPTVPPPG